MIPPQPFSVAPGASPGDSLGDLWRNLRAALPLLALRRVPLTRCAGNTEQALLLVALLAALYFVLDAILVDWPASLNLRALPAALAGDALLLGALALYTRLCGQSRLALPIFVALESLWVWLTLIFIGGQLLALLSARAALLTNWPLVIYSYLAAIVAAARWLPGRWPRRALASTLLHALIYASAGYFGAQDLWVAGAVEAPAQVPLITEEPVLDAQARNLQRELAGLRPQRPDVDDLYAVAFAGDAGENVFMHEVNALRAALEQRFDAQGRVLSLINNDRTVRDTPIASLSNLRAALRRIGQLIDRERDLVVLYVTTHGSEQHELSIAYEPLQLQQLDAPRLAQLLDQAGVKWRVIIISACYSGGFVEPLKNAHTLIMTASDATHPSFGCGVDSDMTYFGRAFVEHALRQTHSLTQAFERARHEIRQREASAGEEHSNPQIFVGAAIAAKLGALEQRLARQH